MSLSKHEHLLSPLTRLPATAFGSSLPARCLSLGHTRLWELKKLVNLNNRKQHICWVAWIFASLEVAASAVARPSRRVCSTCKRQKNVSCISSQAQSAGCQNVLVLGVQELCGHSAQGCMAGQRVVYQALYIVCIVHAVPLWEVFSFLSLPLACHKRQEYGAVRLQGRCGFRRFRPSATRSLDPRHA